MVNRNIPTFWERYRAIGEPCAICAYRREPRKLGRAANRAGAIGCGSSHLRLKADPHSQLRLIGRLIVSAFAGWSAPQPALRASAARQVTKTAFAAHEITRKTTDDCYNSHFSRSPRDATARSVGLAERSEPRSGRKSPRGRFRVLRRQVFVTRASDTGRRSSRRGDAGRRPPKQSTLIEA